MRDWKYGLHRLSQNEINYLDFPDGFLLDVVPSECSLDSMAGMQKVRSGVVMSIISLLD